MFDDVCERSDLSSFDAVGVTCTGHAGQIARAIEIGLWLRDIGIPSVIGGPVTVQDSHFFVPLLKEYFDAVAVGEAESILGSLLNDIVQRRLGGGYKSNDLRPFKDMPLPRFDLACLERFDHPHVFPAQTARGCPRACTFCSEPLYGPWRYRPVDEVVRELELYRDRFGAKYVVFRDDDFLIHPQRSRELLRRLTNCNLQWACQTDLNLTRHLDIVELAVDAGVRSICFGLESIDAENRRDIGKTFFTIEKVPELLAKLNDHGVEIQMNIIFGLDHDTPSIFDRTVDFMLENHVSYWYANILNPEAGTPLYARMQDEGRLVKIPPLRLSTRRGRDLGEALPTIRRSFMEADDPACVNFVPRHLSAEQLVELALRARERFAAERGVANVCVSEKSEY